MTLVLDDFLREMNEVMWVGTVFASTKIYYSFLAKSVLFFYRSEYKKALLEYRVPKVFFIRKVRLVLAKDAPGDKVFFIKKEDEKKVFGFVNE